MLDQGIDEVLILEDDAAVQAAALQLLERVDDLPADREIVLLNHLPEIGGRLSWWHRRRLGALRLGRFYRPAYGTAGYLIRRSAARKILDAAYPVRAPADHWTGGESRLDLRIYGVYPPCIEQLGAHALGGPTIANRQDLRSRWNLPAPPAGIGLILHRTKRRLVDGWLMLDPRRTI
jgi:GR25 family glycosyltransferase involved in LPS biosynthesis